MSTAIGTVSTGVATTATTDLAAKYALDTELISNFGKAANVATAAAIKFQGSMGALAVTILDLHAAGTWERQIDGETGQTYSSPKAFYSSLFNRTNKDGHRIFTPLHKLMRDELVSVLVNEDGKLEGIGTNELAELIGCNAAQVTRSVDKAKQQQAALESAPVDLDKVYADAVAEAVANGADEKTAAHAGEQARAQAKQAESAPEVPETTEERTARELAEHNALVASADKAGKTFVKATDGANDVFHLMTPERRAEVLKAAQELVSSITSFETGLAKANGPKPSARTRKSA